MTMRMEKIEVTHQEFVEKYNSGELQVAVHKDRAGDFVLSPFADKHNKPAHYFWTWLGIVLVIPAPIILFFFHWAYALGSFIAGLMVHQAARKSAGQFVLRNMIQDENFFEYVLLHGGAKIIDREGQSVSSRFLNERQGRRAGL